MQDQIKSNEPLDITAHIEQIIFGLKEDNIEQAIQSIMNLFDRNNPYSFCVIICRILYSFYISKKCEPNLTLNFLDEINKKCIEKENIDIIQIFMDVLYYFYSKTGANYLLVKMYEKKMIKLDTLMKINSTYFAHYKTEKEIENLKNHIPNDDDLIEDVHLRTFWLQVVDNIEQLSKNDWELHKKYIHEGVNKNELSKIIRDDNVEKLQEIASENNFNFSQIIPPSLYERCTFINQKYVSLIDYAAFFSSVKCFKFLMMNNSDLYCTGKYAIAGGNLEIIHLCEQNHSSFDEAYETAIQFHRNDIFKYLYENKSVRIRNLINLGMECLSKNNFEIFSFLLKIGMKIDNHIISKAAETGNIFLTKKLIENNPLPKDILYNSSVSGNIELIKYILQQKGINVNNISNWGWTSLMFASRYNHIKIAKFFIEQEGIDINIKDRYGMTALSIASQNGKIEIVKLLLEQKGLDINSIDNYGKTALIWASEKNNVDIVRLLLEQDGIDIHRKDKFYSKTALIAASEHGNTEIVQILLEQKGIDLNEKGDNLQTPLIYAAEFGQIETVKLLLKQNGIDLNAKDIEGDTALTVASRYGQTEIVTLLLGQEGIDINVKNNKGKTAFAIAFEKGYNEITKLLSKE